MTKIAPEAQAVLDGLRELSRPAAIAEIGGFRPPDDPCVSWFGRAVALPGEGLPQWNGEAMLPLLQIRADELPFVPERISATALLVLFLNPHVYPFDRPHGEGWLICEYASIEGLCPLDSAACLPGLKPFPIRWSRIDDDAPGWEEAWNLIDLASVNDDEAATDAFFELPNYPQTKVGGYPKEIQHGVSSGSVSPTAAFVFQVGSEEKANWMWADNGIGYFFRDADGHWSWSCQFY